MDVEGTALRGLVAAVPELDRHAVGSEPWWQALERAGLPVITTGTDGARVINCYRGGPGIERVLIDVNGLTDHHRWPPAELDRVPGTDVWLWESELDNDFRGSYCFVPLTGAESETLIDSVDDPASRWTWWRSVITRSEADPLNQGPRFRGSWDNAQSLLAGPDAPAQPAWHRVDQDGLSADPERLVDFTWRSAVLGNERRIWVYQVTGPDDHPEPAERPVVLLHDGRHWADRLPIFGALDEQARRVGWPDCVVILVDALDQETRGRELPCHEPYWQAVRDELLPAAAELVPFTDDPARSIVAGQSYGGLAAVHAVMHHHDRFRCAVSQSGSFWWPEFDRIRGAVDDTEPIKGRLISDAEAGVSAGAGLRVIMDVGSAEGGQIAVNVALRDALAALGHEVELEIFRGGHEWLCWRGSLLTGLSRLITG
ncbi:enterochelin esterase [Microlunatus sp. GCM10028923]|uniref:enterochelin esterase n=1 Tax=Microlunatus sp. GCM10028923 TaxID=3273400 RepID=UPI00361060BD